MPPLWTYRVSGQRTGTSPAERAGSRALSPGAGSALGARAARAQARSRAGRQVDRLACMCSARRPGPCTVERQQALVTRTAPQRVLGWSATRALRSPRRWRPHVSSASTLDSSTPRRSSSSRACSARAKRQIARGRPAPVRATLQRLDRGAETAVAASPRPALHVPRPRAARTAPASSRARPSNRHGGSRVLRRRPQRLAQLREPTCRFAAARPGARPGHNSSASRSADTTAFAFMSRNASTARVRAPPTGSNRPPEVTSRGPRTWNSTCVLPSADARNEKADAASEERMSKGSVSRR